MSLYSIVLAGFFGLIPGIILFLVMTKLVGHHVGFSLVWGTLKKQYTTEQVQLQLEVLEHVSGALGLTFVVALIASGIGAIGSNIAGLGLVVIGTLMAVCICFGVTLTTTEIRGKLTDSSSAAATGNIVKS